MTLADIRRAQAGSDPFVNLFGQGAINAGRKHRKFIGYDGNGKPVYRYELTTGTGVFHTKIGTAGGSTYTGKLFKTRGEGSSGAPLKDPRDLPTSPANRVGGPLIPGLEIIDPAGQSLEGRPTATSQSLMRAKADLQAWVNQYAHIWGNDRLSEMVSQINSTDSLVGLRAMQNDWKNILRLQPAWEPVFGEPDLLGGGGVGGGGGGGGSFGPQYVAPDRRVVEDFVKGTMVSLIGEVDEEKLDSLVGTYMTDHRRNFDKVDEEIDPSQSVVEALRNTEKYQEIHQLRPDSEDERQWVARRRSAAQQGGLQQGEQQDFAIQQASIGGDLPDVADAASVAQFQKTGSARGTLLEDKIRRTATNMFRGVA